MYTQTVSNVWISSVVWFHEIWCIVSSVVEELGVPPSSVADGGFRFLCSIGTYLSNCVVSHLGRTQSPCSHVWSAQIPEVSYLQRR